MKTSCNRAVKSVIAVLTALVFMAVGLTAANAEVGELQGVKAVTSATGPGQGSATFSSLGPVTVTVFVIGTGGTLAGGAFEQSVTLDVGAPVSVAYNCVGSSMELGVRLPGKGGPGFGVVAPCGAVVVQPPAASWNQTASIIPGRAGSGNATVEFNNTGSNRDAVFYVTFGDGAPTSATTVAAGQTSSIPVHAGPGVVVRVYGTQDGTAPPKLLKELPLPTAPTPPAASWNQTASIIPGSVGSGNADIEFNNAGSNRDAVFYVTFDGGTPTSATTVAAGQISSISIHRAPGTVVRVFGTQDGNAAPKLLKELPLPKAPATANPPDAQPVPTPVATPVVPAAGQPITPAKADVSAGVPLAKAKSDSTHNTWKRPTFDTAAGAGQSQANLAVAYGFFAIAAIGAAVIAALVFIRRRRVQ